MSNTTPGNSLPAAGRHQLRGGDWILLIMGKKFKSLSGGSYADHNFRYNDEMWKANLVVCSSCDAVRDHFQPDTRIRFTSDDLTTCLNIVKDLYDIITTDHLQIKTI